jgi:cob(I)alamin adenosyltransferase
VKVYTRAGDAGETALFGGGKVSKSHPRVAAYGAVDEANALVGWVAAAELPSPIAALLPGIMSDLFDLGAELATPPGKGEESLNHRMDSRIDEERVAELEEWIDVAEEDLAPLKTFVLPTGTEAAARLHMARTVLRRAEREVVAFHHDQGPLRPALLIYLNRLSDLLFVWARFANAKAGHEDVPWQAKKAPVSS